MLICGRKVFLIDFRIETWCVMRIHTLTQPISHALMYKVGSNPAFVHLLHATAAEGLWYVVVYHLRLDSLLTALAGTMVYVRNDLLSFSFLAGMQRYLNYRRTDNTHGDTQRSRLMPQRSGPTYRPFFRCGSGLRGCSELNECPRTVVDTAVPLSWETSESFDFRIH